MFIDVKKAHLNGRLGADEVAFVQLPGSPPGTCSRLKRWLYGMRQAASAWERDFVEKLAEIGMVSGKSSPVVFHDPKTGVRAVVHGDDFTFLGFETELQQVKRELEKSYQLKVRAILGDDVKDEKTVVILNRKLVWKEDCIEYEADEQHAQKVWSGCGLERKSKGLDTPSIREDSGNHNEDDECLNPQEVKEFRGLAARANYLAQDRPDIQFATKEVCRCMSKPTRLCWGKLKGSPDICWNIPEQSRNSRKVETWTSSRSTLTATGLAAERPASRHREASSFWEESSKVGVQLNLR